MGTKKGSITVKRKVTLFFAILITLSIILPLNAQAITINRFAGVDLFQTAKAIAEQYNSGTVQDVILTTGNNFPDALSVSVLAVKLSAPILLVDKNVESSSESFDYITQHLSKTGTVHIIGGTGAVNLGFETKLKELGFIHIDRIGGYDLYDTDLLIAQKIAAAKNTPVVIASGQNFPDALSISSVASNKGWPILLVGKDYLAKDIKDYISTQQPSQVYIVGGTAVVSQALETQIRSLVPNSATTRLAGLTQFDTNIEIAKLFGLNPKTLYLSTGFQFADALAGSVLAAKTGDPIVLIDSSMPTLPPAVASYLSGLHSKNVSPNLIAFGGTVVVPEANLKSTSDLLTGTAKADSIYSVSDNAVTLSQYQAYTLPTTVTATLYNSSQVSKPVKWNGTVNTSIAGSSVLEGTIDGYKGTVKLTIKVVATTIKTTQYGTSGLGRPLYVTAMEVPKPTKKVLVTFEIHGWDDSYARDGQVLVNMGNAAISYFTAHPNELKTTSLYVVSSSNLDGLIEGWTNNGPGRCQISLGVDINRDFDFNWIKQTYIRNKTLAPFSSPEARALKSLVLEIHPTDVIDIHGWDNTTFGSPDLCSYFRNSIGIGYSGGLSGASGYFTAWATMYARRTALIELPGPSTSQDAVINALKALCNS